MKNADGEKMPHLVYILLGLCIFGMSFVSSGYAQTQTSEACRSTISKMGYPVESHAFVRGGLFSNDRHIYGDIVCEVSSRGEILRIERDGQLLAEDGIFGLGALLLRQEAERRSAMRLKAAALARDNAIDVARMIYEELRLAERKSYSDLEENQKFMLEELVKGLRSGEVNEVAASHFGISANFLAKFGEEDFFSALREQRARESEAERARIEEAARQKERERVQREEEREKERARREMERERREKEMALREEQRQTRRALLDERAAAERRQRELVLGVPVEPDAAFHWSDSFPERQFFEAGRIAIQMIRVRGWTCDSVSRMQRLTFVVGMSIHCNNHRYTYEMLDRGGRWHLELK